MKYVATIEQLLEAGAHYGHLTRRWNPKMEQFIFGERNGIHIIDLRKTQVLLELAVKALRRIVEEGRNVLFIGTKNQAKSLVESVAEECGANYVSERWLGGMLTNFATIRKSIMRLNEIEKMELDGTFEKITKKERLLITREKDRLRKIFGGIESMSRLPGALFIIDIRKEHLAVKEAQILGIPTIALVDTNTNPEMVDFPIPCNDDSISTIELVLSIISDTISKASEIAKVRKAELASEPDEDRKKDDFNKPKIKRKLRERKPNDRNFDRKPKPAYTNDKPAAPQAAAPKEEAPKENKAD